MALRYFYEQMPEFHVVAAGFLLEFAFGEISIPVGRLQYLNLYPMTFHEYLIAMGKEPMAAHVMKSQAGVASHIQQMILSELKNYFFVGGMPECVKTWRDNNSMLETFPDCPGLTPKGTGSSKIKKARIESHPLTESSLHISPLRPPPPTGLQ